MAPGSTDREKPEKLLCFFNGNLFAKIKHTQLTGKEEKIEKNLESQPDLLLQILRYLYWYHSFIKLGSCSESSVDYNYWEHPTRGEQASL